VQLTLPATSSPGDISVTVAARDNAFVPQHAATVDVQLVAADQRAATARSGAESKEGAPGLYRATVHVMDAGLYKVVATARVGSRQLGAATASLLVGGADEELRDPWLDAGALSRIARASGGAVITPKDVSATLTRLRVRAPALALARREDLWSKPWSFAILAVLLSTEWLARRRLGLK
jgi:hypothetical protein